MRRFCFSLIVSTAFATTPTPTLLPLMAAPPHTRRVSTRVKVERQVSDSSTEMTESPKKRAKRVSPVSPDSVSMGVQSPPIVSRKSSVAKKTMRLFVILQIVTTTLATDPYWVDFQGTDTEEEPIQTELDLEVNNLHESEIEEAPKTELAIHPAYSQKIDIMQIASEIDSYDSEFPPLVTWGGPGSVGPTRKPKTSSNLFMPKEKHTWLDAKSIIADSPVADKWIDAIIAATQLGDEPGWVTLSNGDKTPPNVPKLKYGKYFSPISVDFSPSNVKQIVQRPEPLNKEFWDHIGDIRFNPGSRGNGPSGRHSTNTVQKRKSVKDRARATSIATCRSTGDLRRSSECIFPKEF